MVKRYIREPGSELVRDLMGRADGWYMCRVGFVETTRAVGITAGRGALSSLRREWPAFAVVEVDQRLVENAAELALRHEIRSLDALHLASALVLPRDDLTVAVWGGRLHAAVRAAGLPVVPASV